MHTKPAHHQIKTTHAAPYQGQTAVNGKNRLSHDAAFGNDIKPFIKIYKRLGCLIYNVIILIQKRHVMMVIAAWRIFDNKMSFTR